MKLNLRVLRLAAVFIIAAVALPTLLAPSRHASSPYVSALEQAAIPTAAAVDCNGFECVHFGGGGACFQTFDAVWCEATVNGQGNASCDGTFDCQ